MSSVVSLQGVDRCPHCSVAKPLLGQVWAGVTMGSRLGVQRGWGAFCCTNCGGIVSAAGKYGAGLDPRKPEEVFPSSRSASGDIPEPARTFLQQAFDTLHAPDAAAVMAGSAVDAMLKTKGYTDGSLYTRIDKSVEDRLLTKGMADWAHSVRLGSNRPRHADLDSPHVSPGDAKRSVDFAEALGNFLFALSAQIEEALSEVKSGK